jgi:hypothetical protein
MELWSSKLEIVRRILSRIYWLVEHLVIGNHGFRNVYHGEIGPPVALGMKDIGRSTKLTHVPMFVPLSRFENKGY